MNIGDLRRNQGISQSSLARAMGCNQKRISRIERHPELVGLGQIERVLSALGFAFTIRTYGKSIPTKVKKISYVYILRHKHLALIKIGQSDDTGSRFTQLAGYGADVDIHNSHRLMLKSASDAKRIEKVLHRVFSKYRIDRNNVILMGLPQDGASEWFHVSCLSRIFKFIRENRDILGTSIEPATGGAVAALP